jgi:signal recognition particle receptor subunit beta
MVQVLVILLFVSQASFDFQWTIISNSNIQNIKMDNTEKIEFLFHEKKLLQFFKMSN